MKKTPGKQQIGLSIASFAICCGVFFALSVFDLPGSWVKAFSHFGWIHLLLIAALFWGAFQLPRRYALALGGLLTAVIFALPLAVRLSTGLSNATVLAGFLPYKDGFYYYNGAVRLLSGQTIASNGLQGAFRPLFPALLSSLLWLTGGNLLLTLKLMVLGTGLSLYMAALSVKRAYGPLPAAVFFTLVFAFIRPMLGDTLTELPGLAFACLALVLLLDAARTKRLLTAAFGGVTLVLALSIRAGAFFMLPFLILWWGWLHREQKRSVIGKMAVFTLILIAAFLTFNKLIPALLVSGDQTTFGNFSWMLYGQAVGGAGFKYHQQALGTSDSTVVLQAALEKICTYPMGIVIGSAKAYRDFFSKNSLGIFDLLSGVSAAAGWVFWGACIALLAGSLVRSLKRFNRPENALLLAGFLGVLFSIPFLPPIDGGSRFYAGSVPFLFALLVVILPSAQLSSAESGLEDSEIGVSQWSAGISWFLVTLLPLAILAFNSNPSSESWTCADDLIPFVTRFNSGAFVDILPDENPDCAGSPELCRQRFAKNGMDQANDDFYTLLVDLSGQSKTGLRLWAGIEQLSGEYYFWAIPVDQAADLSANQDFRGCAVKMNSQYQQLLFVNSTEQP